MIRLDKDSRFEVLMVWLAALSVAVVLFRLFALKWFVILVWTILAVFCVFITAFFRIPVRNHIEGPGKVTAVADGRICIIDKIFEKEYLKRDCIQVSIYMNFFDVHANFWPLSGQVTYAKYHPGKYLMAFYPKASELNEHSSTAVKNSDGTEILFKQIAGTFARRIVSYSRVGTDVKGSEQCGIIKFGSRIDIFLPLESEILVSLNDEVRACETVIANLPR